MEESNEGNTVGLSETSRRGEAGENSVAGLSFPESFESRLSERRLNNALMSFMNLYGPNDANEMDEMTGVYHLSYLP